MFETIFKRGEKLVELIDQWDRTENPEVHPHEYFCVQLIFDKDTKSIQGRKENFP